METFEKFKQGLLEYLYVEKDMEQEEIESSKNITKEEKIEKGFYVDNLTVREHLDNTYVFDASNNFSKLRAGDRVILCSKDDKKVKAIVSDVGIDSITVSTDKDLDTSFIYDIEIESPNLLGSLIACLDGIVPATPGAAFLRMLANEEPIIEEDFLVLRPEDIKSFDKVYTTLNECQRKAVESILKFYPIHVLQGPPGTGKTLVLSATAIATSLSNREVVVIANTHQAVNNALTKIRKLNNKIPIFKIGELLKTEGLDDSILKFQKFSEYNDYSKANRRKKKHGHIVGMTIWGAISSLGLHSHSHFRPYLALVDEASLMPLTYASILGKCASSVCLLGDSRQMSPIFRPELENNRNSISILDYCADNIANIPVSVLPVTHRMNKEITELVSRTFYEPHGIYLKSAEKIAGDKFVSLFLSENELNGDIVCTKTNLSSPNCREENLGEAETVASIVKGLLDEGNKASDIAVITPFRKQVRLIRTIVQNAIGNYCMPLIDTVERLQGQDVNCIIISFAISDTDYFTQKRDFVFNHNRLNVMISRAKTKVVIIGSDIVQKELSKIIN